MSSTTRLQAGWQPDGGTWANLLQEGDICVHLPQLFQRPTSGCDVPAHDPNQLNSPDNTPGCGDKRLGRVDPGQGWLCPMPDARCPMIVVQDGTTHHCEGIPFGLWQSLGVRFYLRSAGPLRWSTALVHCD